MRFSVLGFNQKKVAELNETLSEHINVEDLLILDYIYHAIASPQLNHILKDDIPYVWLKHKKILEDLPILDISDDRLKRRLKKLTDAGLLGVHKEFDAIFRGSRCYYCITTLCESLRFSGVENNTCSHDQVLKTTPESDLSGVENNTSNSILNILNNKLEINKTQAEPASSENIPEESDFDSHAYQEETPKERYKRQKAERQKSDYQSHMYQEERLTVKDACKEYISKFTDEEPLREVLTDYLNVRAAIKDRPLSLRTWQGMLSKLKNLDGDKIQIVQQSIKEGWASFYPQKSTQTRAVTEQSWDKNVTSNSMTKDDYDKMQAFLEEKAKNGERTVF